MNVCGFLLLLFAASSVNGVFVDIEFLKGFFQSKTVVLTVNTCWSFGKNQILLKQMAAMGQTQVHFYKPSIDINALKKFSNRHYLVLDLMDCASSNAILELLNQTNIFVYPLNYLLLVKSDNFSTFSETLQNYQLLPNVEMITAVFDGESVFLHQPYKVGKINELIWENYGNWSLEFGLVEYYATIPTPQRRANLKQAHLSVVIVLYDNDTWNHLTDYSIFRNLRRRWLNIRYQKRNPVVKRIFDVFVGSRIFIDRNPGIDTFTKQDFLSMRSVLEFLNINYSLLGVDSYGYYDNATGEFNGLVHAIQRGKADVSGVSIYFTEDRYQAVDLVKMGNPLALRFLVKKPSTSYIKNIFWITFNDHVWIASLVVLTISAIAVNIILNWETKHKEKVKQNKYSVSDVTLIALEAVCQQGTTTEPQSFAGRILALLFFGAFMFIYVSYSANIVVLLQSTTEINTIQELLDSRIKAGGCATHYMKNYFESVKKGPLRELYLRKIYPDQYYSLEEGMKKLQQGNFAFHVLLQGAYEYILKNFTNHEICGLQELPGYIEENRGYIALPKHSPYKDIFKVAILKADEYGLQRRTNLRVIMKPRCFSQSATFKSIGIYDCEHIFQLWIFGTVLGAVIFLGEIFTDKVVMKKFAARTTNIFKREGF